MEFGCGWTEGKARGDGWIVSRERVEDVPVHE